MSLPSSKRVLVTGSSGMLGQAIARQFSAGFNLSGLCMGGPGLYPAHYRCDITNAAETAKYVRQAMPEVVIHCAAFTDVDLCEKERDTALSVNFGGTVNVANAVKDLAIFFILISTDYVFDGKKRGPYVETDPVGPLNYYGETKVRAETYLQELAASPATAARFLTVRTSWLYGPGGKNFVETILRAADAKPELQVVSDQKGRPTYTDDLAAGLKEIVSRYHPARRADILHVASKGEASWFDFAREIVRRAGKSTPVKPISTEMLGRPARRPLNSLLDTSKSDAITGGLRVWTDALEEYLSVRQKS